MLQALFQSKHRLRYTAETNPFIEDSLTACVFGLLRYLPEEILEKIWTKALFGADEQMSPYSATMRECFFWPRWPLKDNPSSWCEPDVFCRFDTMDIVIEAKRSDCERLQYAKQWRNELEAYRHTFGEHNGKYLIFFVVGGLGGTTAEAWRKDSTQLERLFSCRIAFLSWSNLWLECIAPVLSNTDLPQYVQNVCEDLRLSLRLFGIATERPIPLCTFSSLVFPDTLRFSEATSFFGPAKTILNEEQADSMSSFAVVAQNLRIKDVDWSAYK